MRDYYRRVFLERRIDGEGYVATQQHRGLAHSDGWPFPTWPQSGGAGWHFSLAGDGYARSLGVRVTEDLAGWELRDLEVEGIDPKVGLRLRVTGDAPSLATPGMKVEAISALCAGGVGDGGGGGGGGSWAGVDDGGGAGV